MSKKRAPLGDETASGRGGLLAELKADPGQVGLETLLREIDKLTAVRALGLPAGLFADASEKLVEAWRARAARSYPSDLRAAPLPVRLTLLTALCWVRAAEITDALVDLLIGLIHKINTRADRRVERELTEDLRRVRGKEGILFRAVHLAGARLRQGRAAGARPRKVPSCSSCWRLGPSPSAASGNVCPVDDPA